MKVSVIIPTKDEPLVEKLVREVKKKISCEIIIVDKSKERREVKGAKVIFQKSDGLGNAVLEGVEHAKGEIIVVMDADFSHHPKYIPRLLEKIERGYDVVIGSRYIRGGKNKDRVLRKIVSKFFCFLASVILFLKQKDNMSGFFAVRKEVFKKINLKPIGFKILLGILYNGKNLKIAEVPICFYPRKAGKEKGGIKEGIKLLRYILKLKLIH